MVTATQNSAVGTGRRAASSRSIGQLLRSMRERMSVWTTTGADSFAAAGAWEDLSRLCDQELQCRGLSRATLARDVWRTFDRSQRTSEDA
jgi:hypothetical protein